MLCGGFCSVPVFWLSRPTTDLHRGRDEINLPHLLSEGRKGTAAWTPPPLFKQARLKKSGITPVSGCLFFIPNSSVTVLLDYTVSQNNIYTHQENKKKCINIYFVEVFLYIYIPPSKFDIITITLCIVVRCFANWWRDPHECSINYIHEGQHQQVLRQQTNV